MSLTRMLAGASLAVVWASVYAQASSPRPDPLDPNAPTTTLTVPRTFDEYVPYKEPKVVPWKDTNAAVSPASGAPVSDMGTMKMPQPAPARAVPVRPMPAGPADHSDHKM